MTPSQRATIMTGPVAPGPSLSLLHGLRAAVCSNLGADFTGVHGARGCRRIVSGVWDAAMICFHYTLARPCSNPSGRLRC